jgi:hypothetical protein
MTNETAFVLISVVACQCADQKLVLAREMRQSGGGRLRLKRAKVFGQLPFNRA